MTNEPVTLPEMLSRAAARWPGNNAVVDSQGAVSFAELSTLVSQASAGLSTHGIGPGERVAVLLPNSRSFVAAHFGVLAIGAASVPLNAMAAIAELEEIIRCSQPHVLITDRARFARIKDSGIATLPWLLIMIVEESNGLMRLQTSKPWKHGSEVGIPRTTLVPEACDVLMFTSGTSGVPKGVMLLHRNILSVIRSVESFVDYSCRDVELILLPLSHSFGLGQLYTCLSSGACACISIDLVFPAKAAAEAHRLQATGISCTPAMLNLLLKFTPELFAACRSHLAYCVVNSAAVEPEMVDRISALNPALRFFHYYGLTEASRTTFICFNVFPGKRASVGRPMPHARLRIVDGDGTELARGATGEIAVAGDALFSGYWQDPAGHQCGTRNAWFHTGDLGYLDEEGFLFLVGRLGDVINVDGQKFHPTEVESVIMRVEGVIGAGVVAVPSPSDESGSRIVGAVTLETGTVLEEAELRTACSRQLQSYKVPKAFVAVEEIPQSQSGKIDRKKLRMMVENVIASQGGREQVT